MKAKSPSQASSANSVRIKHVRLKGPVMGQLAQSEDCYAPVTLAAYNVLFSITDAKFWIESKHVNFDASWATSEVEALMRTLPTTVVQPTPYSAVGYWSQVDLGPIKLARVSTPEPMLIGDLPPAASGEKLDSPTAEHTA